MKAVFDRKDKRPYCVLLQAAMGADFNAARYFDPGFWHVETTDNPMGVEATEEQLIAHNERLRKRS